MAGSQGLQARLTTPSAARFAYVLCRLLPPRLGYPFVRRVARRIAARPNLPVVQAMRLNQWVIDPSCRDHPDLAARECMEYLAIGFYQLFRNFGQPQAMQQLVEFTPEIDEMIAHSQQQSRGLMIAGMHMSGFDLVTQAFVQRGLRVLGLTLPESDANETINWQHDLRRRSGIELAAPSIGNLRLAVARLQAGGMVITGIDRPMPGLKYTPRFFGRPAHLPTHHIYLALKANVPIVVVGAKFETDGCYHVMISPEMHLQKDADHRQEMVANAERVLAAAEQIICQAPRQWTVPYPLWPEVETEAAIRG